jgi:choloylglycine hydrolase
VKRLITVALIALVAGMVIINTHRALACTGVRLVAADGAVVCGRTMEFGQQLDSNLIVIPRHLAMHGTAPLGKLGLAWETQYGAVGMNGLGQTVLVDGMNEKGLAGGIFYMPGYAQYQDVTAAEYAHTLAPWELLTWILTRCATVDEVRAALAEIKVASVVFGDWNIVPGVHYSINDAAGNALVIEYLDGKPVVRDNPVGVITNAPEFDWHLKNLSNYLNLKPTNVPAFHWENLKISPMGQGSGMLGLPGDFTPPSRFVRAAVLSRAVTSGENGPRAVEQLFHVLDSFEIPLGDVRDAGAAESTYELTQWTTAADTRNRAYYFHTYNNRRLRRIELSKADFDAQAIIAIPLRDREDTEDLTPSSR